MSKYVDIKVMSLAAIMVLSSAALAENVIVKECSVTITKDLGGPQEMAITVLANGKTLSAIVAQTSGGSTSSYKDAVELKEQTVRANLTAQSNTDDLNQAEGLIVQAMNLQGDPIFKGSFSSGIDLEQVRSAKMYTIGEKGNMGSSTIVEARDANNQVLGSFLGGFFVLPCK